MLQRGIYREARDRLSGLNLEAFWAQYKLSSSCTDPSKVALEAKGITARVKAIQKLTDQSLLAEIAVEGDERSRLLVSLH